MRRAILTLLVVLAAAGCVEDPPGLPDASGMDASGDGGGGGGLAFDFVARPEVPGDAGGDHGIRLESARIVLESVRVIGDAAAGDARTSQASLVLSWGDGAEHALEYGDAPPGIYSRLLATVVEYELRGSVGLDSGRVPFVVIDTPGDCDISVELGQPMLMPGSSLEVEVEVQLAEPLFEVPWDGFEGAGNIRIDETSPQIEEVREHLAESFEADDHDD